MRKMIEFADGALNFLEQYKNLPNNKRRIKDLIKDPKLKWRDKIRPKNRTQYQDVRINYQEAV